MNFAPILFSLLLSTSIVMCCAMTLAWRHLGRQRYLLSWAIAYAFSVLHWLTNLLAILIIPGNRTAIAITALFPVMTSTLVAVGCRQRTRLPDHGRYFAIGGLAVSVAIMAVVISGVHAGMRAVLPCLYAAVMMAIGIHAVFRVRQTRERAEAKEGLRPAEMAFICILVASALFQLSLAAIGLLAVGPKANVDGTLLMQTVLGIGLPSLHIGAAVCILFLVASDVSEQLRRLVTRDPLTGILNRRGLEEAAAMAIANCQRHGRDLAVVLADIDGFKRLNDELGHQSGDKALVAFTEYAQAAIRHGDVFGRMGGDEFCLILLDTTALDAVQVVERARTNVERLSGAELPGGQLTASFGIAGLRPGEHFFDALVGRADKALYQSKLKGRNCVSIARGDEERLLKAAV